MDKNELEIVEENEVVESDSEENEIVELDSIENSITVSEFNGDIDAIKDRLIPISKDAASQLSLMLSVVPNIGNSIQNYRTLGKTAYSITFNGKNVLPEQLAQKKNGSLFSNLRTEQGWGKQTDINPINNKGVQVGNVVNIAFSVASVATSTYYLHRINSNIEGLNREIKAVKNLLIDNMTSRVEADANELYELFKELDDACSGTDELTEKRIDYIIGRLAHIAQNQNEASIQFRKMIENALQKYRNGKSKEKKAAKEELRGALAFYGLSARTYIIAEKLIEELSEGNDVFESRKQKKTDEYSEMHDSILAAIIKNEETPKRDMAKEIGAMFVDIVIDRNTDKDGNYSVGKHTENMMENNKNNNVDRVVNTALEIFPYDADFLNRTVTQIQMSRARKNIEEVKYFVEDDKMYYLPPETDFEE